MHIDITPLLHSLEAGIGKLPSALIAVVLLTGPTAAWLLYRFVVQPRASRYRAARGINAMWVCPECRSVNALRMAQCYRCDYTVDESDLHVIDPEHGAQVPFGLPLPNATPGMAVGPGRPDLGSLSGLTGLLGLDGLTGVRGVTGEARPTAQTGRDAYPVGPGRARPARPRRAVVADRARTGPAAPSDPPAA